MSNQGPNSCFYCYLVFKDQRFVLVGKTTLYSLTALSVKSFFYFFLNCFFNPVTLFPNRQISVHLSDYENMRFRRIGNQGLKINMRYLRLFSFCVNHIFLIFKDHFQSNSILFDLTVWVLSTWIFNFWAAKKPAYPNWTFKASVSDRRALFYPGAQWKSSIKCYFLS